MFINRKVSRHKLQGFTLLEIQIALVLLVLIMGVLFSALHLASKSWRVGQAQNEMIEEKRLVAEFLRAQISQITPLYWTDTRGSALIFRGSAESIRYVGKLPANRSSKTLSLMELILIEDTTKRRLELGYGRLDPNHSPFTSNDGEMKHTLVLDQIKQLKFEYYGQQKLGSGSPEWSEHWESKKQLPQLIKCQITLLNNKQWPEMFFPIHTMSTNGFQQFILQASTKHHRTGSTINNRGPDIEALF